MDIDVDKVNNHIKIKIMACPPKKLIVIRGGRAIRYKSALFLRQAVGFSLLSLMQHKLTRRHKKAISTRDEMAVYCLFIFA
ncbi:hypothetical protein [Flavobacterium sp. 14A]|uniref:hypothetical protein n=1 Tax=Flavobacterium sp. 14A TaxID=2735896 RepID=UPI001570D22A|nr:hypothetical protein [Flavobacterium sp. 14A]NRT10432.1 hypothetical protein [Flavobacterium sp. 14A]